jgi:hypothetical protein
MAQQMSVVGSDAAKLVFHVVGGMTPGTWCSESASPAVNRGLSARSCPRCALA